MFAARDRCDETVDHIRSVRSVRFKYIRNFLPQRPMLQPCAYKDAKDILVALRSAHAAGRLNAVQEQLFAPTRAAEELYDLEADPHELVNLADRPAARATLVAMRQQLNSWMESTGDRGRTPESAEMYDSDMAVYLRTLRSRNRDPEHVATVERNIALMKQWAREGR